MPFQNFPYTNYHDLNLDWLLHKVKELEDKYASLQPVPTPPDPVPEWYTTLAELEASEAPLGATVVYQGQLYVIKASDNGYAVAQTVNGYAIPVKLFERMTGAEQRITELDLGTLTGVSGHQWFIQGCCYNSTVDCFAVVCYYQTTYMLVEFQEDGTVISRLTLNDRGNDLAWNPVKGVYIQAPMQAGSLNLQEISRVDGSVVNSYQVLPSPYYPSVVAYDVDRDLILAFSGNNVEDGISSPVLLVLDSNYQEIARYYYRSNYSTLKPNTNTYTATQGGACLDGSLVISASVFFNDGFTKCGWRLTQLDPSAGTITAFAEGLYPNAAGVAWEMEGVATGPDRMLFTMGCYNVDSTHSNLVLMVVDPRGTGSF